MEKSIARVAVASLAYHIDRLYDYLIPPELRPYAEPGMRVSVSFSNSNRHCEGIIMELAEKADYEKLKYIDALLDDKPVLTEKQLKLAKWLKARFFCTMFDAVKAMLPAGLWFRPELLCTVCEGISKERAYAAAPEGSTEEKILNTLYSAGGRGDLNVLRLLYGSQTGPAVKRLEEAGIIKGGISGKRKAKDKTASTVFLAVSAEEAMQEAERIEKRSSRQASVLRLLAEIGAADLKEICYFTGAAAGTVRALVKKEMLGIEEHEVFRRPEYKKSEKPLIFELNEQQQAAYSGLRELLESGKASAALLYGVTGSGKTAVYISLIRRNLELGKRAIVLVPEIALTPQLMQTFSAHFGDRVAVLHSSLSIGERYDEWKRIKAGMADVVVGTRSAVFAPIEKLGLLIIDEEQEYTYKSENNPRYHARDAAKFICAQENALLILGSATPSVESMYYARTGKYRLFRMDKRYNSRALPSVIITDMRQDLRKGIFGTVGSRLREELCKNLENGEQSILFINRRGSSASVTCAECGNTQQCPSCSANLTYHSANHRLMCHYCGYSRRAEERCPSCGSGLVYNGAGTQKVEDELKELFPDSELMRMDTDTITASRTHEHMLSDFTEKKIPMLIGTQMIAKGLDIENVTLVGVVAADPMLYSDDYRARERTFNLITQVVGRSGRGSKTGRAVIQTFTPENEVILCAARQDYDAFYEGEIELRRILRLPPFTQLYSIAVSGTDERLVLFCLCEMKQAIEKSFPEGLEARVLGPAPAHILKVNNRYRYRLYISAEEGSEIRALTSAAIKRYASDKRFRRLSIYGDIDSME